MNAKDKVVNAAILWKKVFSFEIAPKAGANYVKRHKEMLEKANDNLFKAVEKFEANKEKGDE